MLDAKKQALYGNIQVDALEIREKELVFFAENFNALSVVCALLAGFAFSGLTDTTILPGTPIFLQLLYYICTALAFMFNLAALTNSVLCVIYGPGMALLGPKGSMDKAVAGMQVVKERTFVIFLLGLVFFIGAVVMFAWISYVQTVAIVITVSILFGFLLFIWQAIGIYKHFYLTKDQMVNGAFATPNEPRPNPASHTMNGARSTAQVSIQEEVPQEHEAAYTKKKRRNLFSLAS